MKKLLLLFLILWGTLAAAQDAQIRRFLGAPSGNCSSLMIAVNQANGDFYTCYPVLGVGTWIKVGSSPTFSLSGDKTWSGQQTFGGVASGANYSLVTIPAATGSATGNVFGLQLTDQTVGVTANWNLWSGPTTVATDPYTEAATAQSVFNHAASVDKPYGVISFVNAASAMATTPIAITGIGTTSATGAPTKLIGQFGAVYHYGSGTLAKAAGASTYVEATSGTITSAIGAEIQSNYAAGGAGVITTNYGLKVEDQTAGVTDYSIYTGLGTVRFGDNLAINNTTPVATVPDTFNNDSSARVINLTGTGASNGDTGLFLRRSDSTAVGFDIWHDGSTGNGYLDGRWSSSNIILRINTQGTPVNVLTVQSTGANVTKLLTTTNCTSSASPAVCAAAPAGSVTIAAAATTVVVNTTAVTANSQIFIQEDSSLGTRLSVTCNTTIARSYVVTARTAATSFTITTSAAPITNPACLSFFVVN